MELIINELSFRDFLTSSSNKYEASERFERFVVLFSRLTSSRIGFSMDLHTYINLNTIEVFPGFCSSQWRNQLNIDKDIKMKFGRMCDRQIIETVIDDEYEVSYEGRTSPGLTMGYLSDYTIISIDDNCNWTPYNLKCDCYSLSENRDFSVTLRNISSIESISENIEDINERLRDEIKKSDVDYLLENLNTIFSSLIFHNTSIEQLKNDVEKQHLPAIIKKLKILDDYFSTWDGRVFNQNAFPTKSVTPESPETLKRFKKQHEFAFDNIGTVIASYHMRYTGNIPGRIYFVPDSLTRKGLICSLTTKLPTVTEPKLKI